MVNPMSDIFNSVYGWYQRSKHARQLKKRINNVEYYYMEVPRWYIAIDQETVPFFNGEWLNTWLASEGRGNETYEPRDAMRASPETMQLIIRKYTSEWTLPEDRSALSVYIEETHPKSLNDVADWFSKTPCTKTACTLLKLAFANNNLYAADAVYTWIQKDIRNFIDSSKLAVVDYVDQPNSQCLFSRMVEHGAALTMVSKSAFRP